MAVAKFQVVDARGEPVGDRVKRLMAEARDAAREQVVELEAALARATLLAAEIASGGEAYPAGVRDVCERLSAEVESRSQQIAAITRNGARLVN